MSERLALRRGNTLLVVGSPTLLLAYTVRYPEVWTDSTVVVEAW